MVKKEKKIKAKHASKSKNNYKSGNDFNHRAVKLNSLLRLTK